MILSFFDYCIIIYMVMYVITAWMLFYHLSRPNIYRLLIACLVAIIWPVVICLIIIIWIDSLLCTIKELITKE